MNDETQEARIAWEAATKRFGDNPAHPQDKIAWYQGWMDAWRNDPKRKP